MSPNSPARKIRARGQLPANWKYRDGRPRWEPGPGLRAAGWKGLDLKDGRSGAWLSEGASIDLARMVNAAVAGWRCGRPVPQAFAAIAPEGAAPLAGAAREDRRAIGQLVDRYLASKEFARLGRQSQRVYRCKLKRFVDVLAGWPDAPGPKAAPALRQAHAADVAKARAYCVDVLDPPPFNAPEEPALKTVYWTLHEKVGHTMAVGTLRVVSAWLEWCIREDRTVRANAAKLVDMTEPPGRIRVASWDELRALVAAAEAMGYASIADSVILGVDLSWSQADRLALTWGQVSREGRVRGVRQKTGRAGETPLLPSLGAPRVAQILARQQAAGAQHTHLIVCESTGKRWGGDHYRSTFREVRAQAAKACPSVATLRDQDLRDTAVTIAYEAGLTVPEICSRTLHSPAQAQKILDNHYGAITRTVGDNAAAKVELYLKKTGVRL